MVRETGLSMCRLLSDNIPAAEGEGQRTEVDIMHCHCVLCEVLTTAGAVDCAAFLSIYISLS